MDEPTVLICGQHSDIHIETVVDGLVRRGARTFLLDRNGEGTMSVEYADGRFAATFETDGTRLQAEAVTAVWWRLKPSRPVEFSGGEGSEADRFRWSEWRAALNALSRMLPRAYWMNDPERSRSAANKTAQLQLAQRLGLTIPDTVIGNDHRRVLRLFDRHERVIYKSLSSYLIPPHDIIYTNEIFRPVVETGGDSIRLAPGIFQGLVDKAFELRVTVVGNEIFSCRIDSQSAGPTKVDWRRDQLRDMYTPATLPADQANHLLAMHAALGLEYAAYDYAVDRQGRHVFLECNPGGQWLFVEHQAGLKISESIVRRLVAAPCRRTV